jgi:hypothetical protein
VAVVGAIIGALGLLVAIAAAFAARGANRRADEANELAEAANRIAGDAVAQAERSADAAERANEMAEARFRAAPRITAASYSRSASGGYVSCGIANASGAPGTLREMSLVVDQGEPLAAADRYASRAVAELPVGGSVRVRFDVPTADMQRHGERFSFLVEGIVEDALGSRPFTARYMP